MQKREGAEAGFSLIEMLVVLALLAVASAAALQFGFRPPSKSSLLLAATRMATELKAARSAAMASNRPADLLYNPATKAYQSSAMAAPVAFPASFAITFEGGNDLVQIHGAPRVVFYPDGSSTGGRFILAEGGSGFAIDIETLTGAVSLTRVHHP